MAQKISYTSTIMKEEVINLKGSGEHGRSCVENGVNTIHVYEALKKHEKTN